MTHVLPSEILLGIGLGLAIVPCISTATQNAEPKDVGVTSAMTNTSQQIGASIGTALMNTIAAAATKRIWPPIARKTAGEGPRRRSTATPSPAAGRPGSFVLAALVGGVLINVHPGQQVDGRGDDSVAGDVVGVVAGVDDVPASPERAAAVEPGAVGGS